MTVKPSYVVIFGPTASGKSELALRLAGKLKGEIVNFDSVQVYRGFDLGSAKPTPKEQSLVRHHLIDILEGDESFDAMQFAKRARAKVGELQAKGILPILVGGTGLYLRAFWGEQFDFDQPKCDGLRKEFAELDSSTLYHSLEELDPPKAKALHPHDRFRVTRALELYHLTGLMAHEREKRASSQPLKKGFRIALVPRREELVKKIALRTQTMLARGLLEEVRGLLNQGFRKEAKPMQTIGYKQCVAYLNGELSLEELPEAITIATRQYAKRQVTWFKKVDRDLSLVHPTEGDLEKISLCLEQKPWDDLLAPWLKKS